VYIGLGLRARASEQASVRLLERRVSSEWAITKYGYSQVHWKIRGVTAKASETPSIDTDCER
jgi:hypothetical protein